MSSSLLKEFEKEKNKCNVWSSELVAGERKERKVITVNPLSRSENVEKIDNQDNLSKDQGNKIDVLQLERQCKDLEDQLDQVKHQIVKIVTDKNDFSKENAVLKNYQIAFTSLTEQNSFLKQKLEMNTTMLDASFEGSFKIPDTDRTSPDGQEKEKEQALFKSTIEYETELKTLVDKVTVLMEEKNLNNEKLKDLNSLQEKNKELEESLDMIREEFENMEDYWEKKLNDERSFYEEQLKMSETQFKELEQRLKEYDEVMMKTSDSRELQTADDDKLSTIEETFSLECQVGNYTFPFLLITFDR